MKALRPSTRQLSQQVLEASRQEWQSRTARTHLRVFKVAAPVTVFLRGTKCHVSIQHHDLEQVEIHARLYHAFGLQFVTEQDEAGVYIVVKRRRFWGWLARADCILKVPYYAHLAFNLTQGRLTVENINSILEIPPARATLPSSIPQFANPQYNKLNGQN